jgi:flagellar FliL protein
MKKIWIALLGLLLAGAGAGGAAAWYLLRPQLARAATAEPTTDTRNFKYVSLDKVIVMLRDHAGQPLDHYLAVDLVFKTSEEDEKVIKEHLPLLRSVAVKALSAYPMDQARQMNIDQFAEALNKAFNASYAHDRHPKPFEEAMIGKLIIE